MNSAWARKSLLLLLCFAAGPVVSPFSPSLHADSGSLYVSTESVLAMLKKRQEILFVDIRNKEAFDRLRIPGSIHVPLYALKTKPFLKDKPLVLVGEGYPNFALEQLCKDVRAAGFNKTSILNGGLRSWIQKKGPIEGDAFAAHEVSRVPPKVFLAQKDAPAWLVITVSDSGTSSSQPLIPGAVPLPLQGGPQKFVSTLKTILSSKPGSPQVSILVCDERGESYESIEIALQQQEIHKVFYLKGGLEAYRAFRQQQSLLAQPGRGEVKQCVSCQ